MTTGRWRRFITDTGTAHEAVPVDGGESIHVPCFAVWEVHGDKPEVINTSDDLNTLQREHGPGLRVLPVSGQRER